MDYLGIDESETTATSPRGGDVIEIDVRDADAPGAARPSAAPSADPPARAGDWFALGCLVGVLGMSLFAVGWWRLCDWMGW